MRNAMVYLFVGTLPLAASADIEGPSFPPPGGVEFVAFGESAGDEGGITFALFEHDPDVIAAGLYYGKNSELPVQLAMDGEIDSPGESLSFEGIDGNQAVWIGESTVLIADGGGYTPQPIDTRFTMTMMDSDDVPIDMIDPLSVDPAFPANVGAVIQVTGAFQTTWRFEAFWNGTWQAVNPLFDSLETDPDSGVVASFNSGYYVDVPSACEVADLDGSGDVTSIDLNIVLSDFGCTGGGCEGDVDGNGSTGSEDLNAILGQFGVSCG